MIVTVTAHKTVDEIAVVSAGPELADTMGKFEFARWQQQHKAYWVEVKHLAKLTEQLDRLGHTVVDNRRRGSGEALYVGPLPECSSCGAPASRRADRTLRRCPSCGAPWRSVLHNDAGSGGIAPPEQCTGCAHKQRPGGVYCGQCGAPMPPPATGAPRPVLAHIDRPPVQDPIPVGECIPAHLVPDVEEEPERERYP